MNVEHPAESADSRGAVFDLKCKDVDGAIFIVEVQNAPQAYFYERGLYYLCRIICSQDEQGREWKFKLYPVYGVFLLNFKSGRTDKLRTNIVLADRETGKQLSDTIHQIYLEMPYFSKSEDECKTSLDYWLYTLIYMEQLETLPFKGQKQLFEKLERLAKVVNLNKKERAEYEESLKVYRDNQGVLDYAIESGFEEGMAKGMEKGMAKGKAEMAGSMKRNGMDIQSIILYSGLTAEEIAAL